jgi:hypothetical protein
MNETAQEDIAVWLGCPPPTPTYTTDSAKSNMPCPFSVPHPPRKWFAAPPLWKLWGDQASKVGVGVEQHLFQKSSLVCNVDGLNTDTKKGELGVRGYLRSHLQGPYVQMGVHGTDVSTPPIGHLHIGNKWVTPTSSELDARAYVQPFAGVNMTKGGDVSPTFGVSVGFEFA